MKKVRMVVKMNKKLFIEILSSNLKGLPKEEKLDILSDFEEHFAIGNEKGRSEEELTESLGDPKALAKQMRAASLIKKAETNKSASNITQAIFASIGLGFFNIIFLLGPFIAAVAVIISLFSVAIAIAAAGITGFFGSILSPLFSNYINTSIFINPVVGIFTFIGVGAFGGLFFIGDVYIAKYMYKLTVRYLKFNMRIITGRRQKDEI
jgi:uncharacterized membrane protein